jgi:hypothetical protein
MNEDGDNGSEGGDGAHHPPSNEECSRNNYSGTSDTHSTYGNAATYTNHRFR